MAFPYVPNPTWANDEAGGTEIDAAALNLMEQGIVKAGVRGTGTSAPSSPTDGDLWRYPADATNGVYWLFQYLSSASDWLFLGGPPLYAEVTTSENTTSVTYAALATAGPSIALPFAGDWIVDIGMRAFNNTVSNSCFMSYDIGGTGAVDADAIDHNINAANSAAHNMRRRRKTGLTAVTLTAKYRVGGNTGTFSHRWVAVTPVRHTP